MTIGLFNSLTLLERNEFPNLIPAHGRNRLVADYQGRFEQSEHHISTKYKSTPKSNW